MATTDNTALVNAAGPLSVAGFPQDNTGKTRLCRRPRIGELYPPKCDTRASYKRSDRAEFARPPMEWRHATTIYGTHPSRVVRYWWAAGPRHFFA